MAQSGWLEKQIQSANEEINKWPGWMRAVRELETPEIRTAEEKKASADDEKEGAAPKG